MSRTKMKSSAFVSIANGYVISEHLGRSFRLDQPEISAWEHGFDSNDASNFS